VKKLLRKLPGYGFLLNCMHKRMFNRVSSEDLLLRDFYRQFVASGDLVFDVGANMGNRTKPFLMLGAKVVAFEPQAVCADFLQVVTAGRNDFTLVRKALGESEGRAEMMISDINVISTLSREWQAATQASGRFGDARYNSTEMVEMTTLDSMIEKFGCPRFIKIDVEGYEYEVLSGLSRPVQYISIEFTPEYKERAYACVGHFDALVKGARYQLSYGESLQYALADWVSCDEVVERLEQLGYDFAGDGYMRSVTE